MQPPRLADTAERDYFTLREAGSLCKQLEGTQKYINEQQIELPISMGNLMAIIVSNTHALPAEYKCFKVIKPSNPFTNVCWVSVLTTFSAPPQILAASTVFLPNSRNEEMMGDGFLWCYCCRFVWTVNVCWAHPVISRASAVASSIFFMVLFLMLFVSRRIVCVEN